MKKDCLKCGEEFESEGIHNRLCRDCKDQEIFNGMDEKTIDI